MKLVFAGLLLSFAACGGSSTSGGSTMPSGTSSSGGTTSSEDVGSLSLQNESNYDIYSIQLAPYDDPSWGQNLLGEDALLHGESAMIAVTECKKYDLRMVDDENAECIIQDIDLCFEDKTWAINDTVLAVCSQAWAD